MNPTELMGKVITVDTVLKRMVTNDDGSCVEWKPLRMVPRAGWVVGVRYKQNGIRRPAVETRYDDDEYEPPYLEITKTVPCLLVAFWPTQN